MRETAVLFGEPKTLVGVVTDPGAGALRRDLACVFLNAGFTHRVGPQRSYVLLARRLGALGITCLRFDHSGIGDSPGRTDNLAFEDSTIAEARQAMNFLEATRGMRRFVLAGVCWGADNALRVGGADPRVAGAAAIDFYALMSVRWLLRAHKNRLVDAKSWGNVLRGRSPAIARIAGGVIDVARRAFQRGAETKSADGIMPIKPPAAVLADLRQLVDRGAELCFAYAQGAPSYDQYVMHFRRGMRELQRAGKLRVELFPQADHVFTLLSQQSVLIDAVVDWVDGVAQRIALPLAPARGKVGSGQR